MHQLRYLLGYGDHSHEELGAQGHGYLALLAPVLAVALVALLADFAARLVGARAAAVARPRPTAGFARSWALASACVLAAYAAQELVEGAVAAGHPAGAAALASHGGWVALPLAAAIGLALALIGRGAEGALALAAEPAPRAARPRVATVARVAPRPRFAFVRPRERPAGARAPPLLSA